MQAKIDKGYHEIKEWNDSSFGRLLPHHAAYFTAELKRTGIPSIATAVEIGFGAGAFLMFCAKNNINCLGVELDSHQVDLARTKGFDVITAAELGTKVAGMPQVDLVVLFDVLEHTFQRLMSYTSPTTSAPSHCIAYLGQSCRRV